MGLYGTILIFPTQGSPSADPETTTKQAIQAFEKHHLLLPNTVDYRVIPRPHNRIFAEHIENGDIAAEECVTYKINPERITSKMSDLVYLLDVDAEGCTVPIELPYIEFAACKKQLPIINSYDGSTLCNTWAIIGFSYEDARYNEEIHRIRNNRHPVLQSLSEVFNSPISWGVQIG